MKVIFLDFDGVLNSAKSPVDSGTDGLVIESGKMELLKQIVDATGAEIVLSTSWREYWSADPGKCGSTGARIRQIFDAHGLRILDKTPVLHTRREQEIVSWLEAHPEVREFVVLDDRLMGDERLKGHIIKTSFYFGGLDETDVQSAIKRLNRR